MNQWYGSRRHKPVMDKAHETWFDAFYIRKWRLPAEGESLTGPLFCETAIVPDQALGDDTANALAATLTDALHRHGASAFETLAGEFEAQPFQFVGPLEEFPQLTPVRYLLLTHWSSSEKLDNWLTSPEMARLSDLGAISTDVHVQITHAPGEREGLKADGSQRGWSRPAAAV